MRTYLIILILLLFISCNDRSKKGLGIKDSSFSKKSQNLNIDTINSPELVPVWGYRFVMTGDFNGDGKLEKLTEHYFSSVDKKETNKFYDNVDDYTQLVDSVAKKQPISFMTCDDSLIDTLPIAFKQQFGLAFMKNEGDLNGDGTDELSYVVDWADWSSTNSCKIITYKNRKWKELYSFPIWEWQLPGLPQAVNQYGLFGLENKMIIIREDTMNSELEKSLRDFDGLLRKVESGKIEVVYRNKDADMDTMIIDLKRIRQMRDWQKSNND